jgi:uncharacterized protein
MELEFEFSSINAIVLGILFIAMLARGTFGFADGLISVPFLVMLLGTKVAVPIVALIGATISLVIFFSDLKKVDWAATWRLVVSAFVGIPLGIHFLQSVPEYVAAGLLGLILLIFAIYSLSGYKVGQMTSDRPSYIFGFIAGCLAGAWNTAGPPIVLYGTLKGWPPDRFRATLQGYFVPTNCALVVGHFVAGNVTPKVAGIYVACLPLGVIALVLGTKLNGLIPAEKFAHVLHILLLILGIILVSKAVIL